MHWSIEFIAITAVGLFHGDEAKDHDVLPLAETAPRDTLTSHLLEARAGYTGKAVNITQCYLLQYAKHT